MKPRTWFYVFREALASVRINGFMSFASVGTVTISMAVLAIFLLMAINLDHLALTIEDQVEITVFLNPKAEGESVKNLQTVISGTPGVASARFISKDEAINELKKKFGDRQDLLEGIGSEAIRPSFQIRLADPSQVTTVARQIAGQPGVEKVDFMEETVKKIFRFTRALRLLGLTLAIVLAGATVFIISNTIRLTVFARRREIGIMKLVGATDSFIRRPFMVEGMLLGLLGSLLSALVVWTSYSWAVKTVVEIIPFFSLVPATPLMTDLTWLLLALGAVLGAAGSALALHRFLRV